MRRSRLVIPLYALAEGASYLGNSAVQVVLPWLVLARTGDPAAAGLVLAVAGVAQIAATLVGGSLIDRFGARRVAVLADIGSAVSVAALAVVDLTGRLTLPLVAVLAVAGALFDVPGMTARQTLMRRVAERGGSRLEVVSGIRQAMIGVTFLVGPAAAGLLLTLWPPAAVLGVTALCSAAAAAATLAVRVPPAGTDDVEPGLTGSWRIVRRTPILVRLFVVSAGSSLISAPLVSVLLPAFFAQSARPDLLGYTLSALALGIVGGSVAFTGLTRVSRRLAWTVALLTIPVGLAGVATLAGFWAVGLGAVVVGVGVGIINPIYGVVVSERVPESHLGRVMGLSNVVSLLAGPVGLAAAAAIITVGTLPAMSWGIAAAGAVVAALGLFGRSLRDLEQPPATPAEARPPSGADAHH